MSELLGAPRVHLRTIDSTNDRARELALQGAPHGTLVTADRQTAGRGRHGRRWSAPPRSAVLMSLLLRWPADRRPPALLPLSVAVAVCDVAGPEALVKWPNDVVVRSAAGTRSAAKNRLAAGNRSAAGSRLTPGAKRGLAKLAGILIEGRPQESWLVLGIGLNVAVDLADLPEDVRSTAATMGRPPEAIEPTLMDLLQALSRRFEQPAPEILKAWRSRDALLGSPVASGPHSGIAEGVDDQGRLLVRADDGSLLELDSGEIA